MCDSVATGNQVRDRSGHILQGPVADCRPAEYVGEKDLDQAVTKQFRARLRAAVTDRLAVTLSYWTTAINQDFQRAYAPTRAGYQRGKADKALFVVAGPSGKEKD